MNSFVYHAPTEVVFGVGAVSRTAEFVKKYGGTRVLLVYGGGSAERSGLLAQVRSGLAEAGISCLDFGGARPNPLLSHAREGVKTAIEFGADFILAVGGGSAIDTAKAIAHGTANPETDIWEFWSKRITLQKSMPVASVLTLPAAGSEMSNSAVLTNTELGLKSGLSTDFNRARFAILDPVLVGTVPEYHAGCGAADILMHTLERWFTDRTGNWLTDRLAVSVMRCVTTFGPRFVSNRTDTEAASEILWAGSLSHNSLTGLGGNFQLAVHKFGHALSATYNIAHGASLTALWCWWAREVRDWCPDRFTSLGAELFGIDPSCGVDAVINRFEAFFKELGMPTRLSETKIGILSPEALSALAELIAPGETKIGFFDPLCRERVLKVLQAANC